MGKFKGLLGAAAIAALGVFGNGCDDDPLAVAVNDTFGTIDATGDGVVSTVEWDATFRAWDINGDGFLAPSEYLLNDGFTVLDVDANGLVSLAEWDAGFTLWDVNGDAVLESNELFF